MSIARRVAKNTSILFIAQTISYILLFFTAIYTARYLGVEGFGTLSLALALTSVFGVFVDLGMGTLVIRDIARDKSLKNKYTTNIIGIKLFLTILTFGLIVLTITIFNYPENVKIVIYLITVSMIITAFSSPFTNVFQAFEKMEIIAISSILNCFLVFTGVLICIYLNKNIYSFAFVYIITSIICLILNLGIYIWKFSLPSNYIDLKLWKSILKEGWPFAVTGIFVSIYFWIDSVMLSIMIGNEAVGFYNSAYRILVILLFIPSVFLMALFPVMSNQFNTARNLLKIEYEKAFKYLFLIAIFIFVNGTIFADKIIYLIFGNGYLPAVLILQILMLVVPVMFLNILSTNILSATNKQMFISTVAVSMALFNVTLNIFLIPKYSYIGASVATILTETLGFIFTFVYINKYFFKISITEYIFKPILAGFLFIFTIYYIKLAIPWFFTMLLGVFTYLAILYLFKLINKDDKDLFKQILTGETIE